MYIDFLNRERLHMGPLSRTSYPCATVSASAGNQRAANDVGGGPDAVARIDRTGQQRAFNPGELYFGDAMFDQAAELCPESLFQRSDRATDIGYDRDRELTIVDLNTAVPGVHAGGDSPVDDQRAIESAGRAAAQCLGQHQKRIGMLDRALVEAGRAVAECQPRQVDPGAFHDHALGRKWLRFDGTDPGRNVAGSNRPKILLGQHASFFDRDVPGEDQNRVIGRVVRPVEGKHFGGRQGLDLALPTDVKAPASVH